MKKILFVLLFLLIVNQANAVPIVLYNKEGQEVGTSNRPLKVSVSGGISALAGANGVTVDPDNDGTIEDKFFPNGGLTIGATYSTTQPPANGLLVEGNIGAGTTSPTASLDVSTTNSAIESNVNVDGYGSLLTLRNASAGTSATGNITLCNNLSGDACTGSGGVGGYFQQGVTSSGYNSAGADIFNASDGYLAFQPASSSSFLIGNYDSGRIKFFQNGGDQPSDITMLFDLNQNVGIGISAPASKLTIKGNLAAGLVDGTTAAPTNGALIMGNVGIGQTAITSKLHLLQSATGTQMATFEHSSTSDGPGVVILSNESSGAGNSLLRVTRSVDMMRMMDTGKLLITQNRQWTAGNVSATGFAMQGSMAIGLVDGTTAPPTNGLLVTGGLAVGAVSSGTIKAQIQGGDLYMSTASKGFYLTSPDASCSYCTVNNSDVFACVAATCP